MLRTLGRALQESIRHSEGRAFVWTKVAVLLAEAKKRPGSGLDCYQPVGLLQLYSGYLKTFRSQVKTSPFNAALDTYNVILSYPFLLGVRKYHYSEKRHLLQRQWQI